MPQEPITVSVDTDLKRELEKAAAATGRQLPDVVREALEAYLEAYRWQADQLAGDMLDDDENGRPRCRKQ